MAINECSIRALRPGNDLSMKQEPSINLIYIVIMFFFILGFFSLTMRRKSKCPVQVYAFFTYDSYIY